MKTFTNLSYIIKMNGLYKIFKRKKHKKQQLWSINKKQIIFKGKQFKKGFTSGFGFICYTILISIKKKTPIVQYLHYLNINLI